MIKTFYKTQDGEEFNDISGAQAHEYWLIRKENNQAQELMFELMKIASFNSFNGETVVEKLKKRKDLWEGCVMDSGGDGYAIRDIGGGSWNVDTLLIRPKKGKEEELLKWAKRNLYADEVDWKESGDGKLLSLWWD